jgi:hypothetical protein
VTITGSGFNGTTQVRQGGAGGTIIAGFTVVNDNTITYTAPAGSGTVYVLNGAGNTTSAASVSISDYITAQAGNYNAITTWVGNAVPPNNTGITITIAHNVTGDVSTNTGNLIVNSGASFTVNSGITYTAHLATTNNGIIQATGTYATGGTITNNGTFTVGNGTTGALQINQGGFYTGTSPAYNLAASTLIFNNTSGPYGVTAAHTYWPFTNGPVTVTIQNGGGVQLQTGVARTITNLNIGAELNIVDANGLTVNGTTTVLLVVLFQLIPLFTELRLHWYTQQVLLTP